jgi:hypothetical protein
MFILHISHVLNSAPFTELKNVDRNESSGILINLVMVKIVNYVVAFGAMLIYLSCTQKDEHVIGSPEVVLPGVWNIVSVELTDYDEGVSYEGSTFFNDTVLTNVGIIQISSFSLDSLEALDLGQHKVECLLEISGGQMSVSINSLFRNGTDWRANIFYNGPEGYQAIDTPIEEFYSTAHIFNNFYTMEIEDHDTVKLWTSNANENHVITLVRG